DWCGMTGKYAHVLRMLSTGTAQRGREIRAGQRHVGIFRKAQYEGRHAHLQNRGGRIIAENHVGLAHRNTVHGASMAHAQVPIAGTPEVLDTGHGAAAQYFYHAPPPGTKRTLSPGCSKEGESRLGSNRTSDVRPMICQPPGPVEG